MSTVRTQIRSLSVADRLRLLEEIWDSLAETPEAIPVTDAQEHVVKDGPGPSDAAKGIGFVRRRPGMPVEAFQRHWREVHGPLGAAVPTLRRYVQSPTRRAAYDRGREPAWDGVAIIWFDDAAALRAATDTHEWARAKADDPNFLAPGPVTFIMTTEHVIVA